MHTEPTKTVSGIRPLRITARKAIEMSGRDSSLEGGDDEEEVEDATLPIEKIKHRT